MANLESSAMTLDGMLDAAAVSKPGFKIYIDDPLKSLELPERTFWTIHDCARFAEDLASRLHELGARQGQRILVAINNSWEINLLAIASAKVGMLPLLVHVSAWRQHSARFITLFDPHYVILDSEMEDQELALHGNFEERGFGKLRINVRDAQGGESSQSLTRSRHTAVLCTHTSGTTGQPKVVAHSNYSLFANQARIESMRYGFWTGERADRYLSMISFAHVRSLVWTNAQCRTKIGSIATSGRASMADFERVLMATSPTMVEAQPNHFLAWETSAETRPELLANVRYYMNSFDAIHPRTVRKFLAASQRSFPVWGQGWAQTEVGPMAVNFYFRFGGHGPTLTKHARRFCGIAVPGVKFMEEKTSATALRRLKQRLDRHSSSSRRRRSILVQSGGRALGYWNSFDDTSAAYPLPGWWATGDEGTLIGSQFVSITERSVEKGSSESVIAIESDLLDAVPGLRDVVYYPPTAKGHEEKVVAIIDDDLLGEEAIRMRITEHLGATTPVRVVGWSSVPRTGTNKVRRQPLYEQEWESNERYEG